MEAGRIRVNGLETAANATLKAHDLIEHEIHRHEPAVTVCPPKIVYENEGLLIVDKPASIPVHPTGVYYANTINEILRGEHHLSFISSKIDFILV